jgi:uncharacterized RDD family membrane protein YckC
MHPSDPVARALAAASRLPPELGGLDSDALWAALLTSVQNVVLGEIRRGRYPELGDEAQRPAWPALLDRLGHEARVRIGSEIVDELTVGTVDELWGSWMRLAGDSGAGGAGGSGGAGGARRLTSDADATGERAVTSRDPRTQERVIALLEVLGEVVDAQLADRFGVLPDESRPEPTEFSLSDAGPAPEPLTPEPLTPEPAAAPGFEAPVPVAVADAGLVVSIPPAWAEPPVRPAGVPVFDWEPDGDSAPGATSPTTPLAAPAAPGWRAVPTGATARTPASFGRRAGAYLIDRAIAILITTLAAALLVWPAASAASGPRTDAATPIIALAVAGFAAVNIAWFVLVAWMTGTRGASPGKRLLRIEVVGFSSPGRIGFARGLLRELILAAFAVGNVLTAWLPYASVFWDPRGQLRGWHDRAVDDIVVDVASV